MNLLRITSKDCQGPCHAHTSCPGPALSTRSVACGTRCAPRSLDCNMTFCFIPFRWAFSPHSVTLSLLVQRVQRVSSTSWRISLCALSPEYDEQFRESLSPLCCCM